MRLFTLLFFLVTSQVFAQTLKRAEYFFDSDPGKGNGTSLAITQAASINQTFSINTNSLSSGLHTFNLRIVDSNGHWSLAPSRSFFVVAPSADAIATTLKRAEYFFDTDPGVGSGHALTITPGGTQNNSFAISLAGLTAGFHQLAVRYQDNQGHWSVFTNRTFFIAPTNSAGASTALKKVEYFFDSDPGEGNGKPLTVTAGSPENNLFAIPITSLSSGFHQLCVRYQDNQGHWSLFTNRTFYIVPTVAAAPSTSIKKAEYFFDTDPGVGMGTSYPIAAGNPQNNLFAINISSLTPGFHQLCVRYQDNQGRWSLFTNRTFYIVPPVAGGLSTSIKKAEYFFDTDPGAGKGTSYPIAAGSPQNDLFAINISSLSSGFHQLCLRFQDNLGRWSEFTNRTFYIVPAVAGALSTSIKKAEYFFDTDPGTGKGTSYPITSGNPQNDVFAININSLAPGFHELCLRFQDNVGRWSTFAKRTFYIISGSVVSTTLQKIEYFIDTDPGTNKATSLSFAPAPTVNQLFTIDLGTTPPGNHMLYVRTKDSNGYWSEPVVSAPFSILSCTLPTAPLAINGSRCDVGSVTLSASGATGSQQYHWYANGITNTILFTGPAFSTPSLNGNTDYYASIYDPSTGCESSRTKISALLTIIPKPVLNPSGSLTLCQGNSVSIAAPPGYTSYDWGSGPSAQQQVTALTSGSYSVKVGDGTCTSVASDPLTLTVVPKPVKPIVQANGNTTICGSGSVTLTAPVGAAKYNWSDNSTSQTLTASAAGNYSVQVTDANNCQSDASDQVAVQVIAVPPKPVITPSGFTTLCTNSSVTLSAPQGFANYQWSTSATSSSILVTNAGSYSVTVSNGTCTSVASDPVVVTISPKPIKPIVQTNGSTTICGSGSVTLTAPVGASSYLWSDNSTGQTLVASAAGNYSVQITDANNCQSDASDQVVVQVIAVPPKPVITPSGFTTLCTNSSVTLSAPQGFANYQWSTSATSSDILVTNAGSYSVTVSNGTCTSVASDPVVVTVVPKPIKPIVQTNGNATICGSGSVTLTAPVGASGYLWSDNSTSQTFVASAPGNYSVQITDSNNCQSQPSDPTVVQVVAVPGKPVITSLGSTTLCANSSVTLSAPQGFANYQWSTRSTSSDILVTNAGTYSLTVSNGTCTSVASDPVVVTVSPKPSKPIVQTNGNATICGSGSITLTAPAGATKYIWSDNSTNQTLVASAAGNYSVQISDANNCQSDASDQVAVQVVAVPPKPVITPSGPTTLCINSSVTLSAPQGFANYQWSSGATSADIIVTNAGNYSVTVGNGTCISVASDPVVVTAGAPPAKPVIQVQGNSTICGSGSVLLTVPASASSYIWSDGSNGQQVIASAAGKYSVQITDANNCKSLSSDEVVIRVVTIPSVPSIKVLGSTSLCLNATVILAAPSGFLNYRWSSGDTTAAVLVSSGGNYSVAVGNAPNCLSTSSIPATVTLTNEPCTGGPGPNDVPPSIADATINIPVGTEVSFDLKHLIKKGTVGVNLNSLRIVLLPINGAKAALKSADSLLLDFRGSSYVGEDSIGIQVCDSLGSCTQRTLSIDVIADVEVFNAVSPFPDNINDFFNLKYIDKIEDTKKNKVTIVDRWGNEVFSIADYNNTDRIFIGNDNTGKELPSGTYYYRIDFDSGRPTLTGFISLKR